MDDKNTPLVSILVSCYNVERFIPNFFKNIAEQTYKNIELIVVNDGSTDRTSNLLEKYNQEFSYVKIINHKTNQGLGAGRNTGLNYATGKYIYFCDVDDYVDPNLLEYCTEVMEKNDSLNFMIFGFEVSYPDLGFANETIKFKEFLLESNQSIRDIYIEYLLLSRHGNGFVWNKFYRKSYITSSDIHFGNQKIQQDEVFNIKALLSADSIYISPRILYRYNIFSKGNNGARYIEDRFEIFIDVRKNFEIILDSWHLRNDKTQLYLNNRFFGNVLKCLLYDLQHPVCPLSTRGKKKRFQEIIKHPYTQEFISYFKKNKTPLGKKDKIYLSCLNNYMLFYLINWLLNTTSSVYRLFNRR